MHEEHNKKQNAEKLWFAIFTWWMGFGNLFFVGGGRGFVYTNELTFGWICKNICPAKSKLRLDAIPSSCRHSDANWQAASWRAKHTQQKMYWQRLVPPFFLFLFHNPVWKKATRLLFYLQSRVVRGRRKERKNKTRPTGTCPIDWRALQEKRPTLTNHRCNQKQSSWDTALPFR